jgi:hypothetical protein
MKKYVSVRMIRQSRFVIFFETWSEKEKEQLIAQMNRLIEENREYTDANNYGHLCNLLTSIAMILVLEENGKTREEAEKEVAEAMYEFIKPQIISMKKLASHGWFVKFLKIAMPIKFKKTLGYGWSVEFPECPSDTFTMITHRCIYQQLFAKYGMPEMTARFCKVDDILYSDLPRAEFSYTEQIGNGGSICDYTYKKR